MRVPEHTSSVFKILEQRSDDIAEIPCAKLEKKTKIYIVSSESLFWRTKCFVKKEKIYSVSTG